MSLLSGAYGGAARLRRAWYDGRPHRRRMLDAPVISVGNLGVGGSGKTPCVAALARWLLAAGERPAILSRGYGRQQAADGVLVVSDGRDVLEPVRRSGDEPQMLARALPGVPVLVSADRYLAGRFAECRLGCTVHLLDDGFQHLQLARQVDLLLMSGADVRERVLPWGRLREPIAAARVADALLTSGTADDADAVAGAVGTGTLFRVVPRYGEPRLVEPFGAALAPPAGRRVLAVAGIARPARFVAALEEEGWDLVRTMVFRDHHWFTPDDLAAIRRAGDEGYADLIMTTEKDAVRFEPVRAGAGAGAARPIAYLPMEVSIEPGDQFAAWLTERLSAARGRRAAGVA